MKNRYIRDEFGGITKVAEGTITVSHKNSEEEYQNLKTDNKHNLFSVKNKLEKHLSRLQLKILQINLSNIENGIDYYFNTKTDRINSLVDKKLVLGFRQINDILRNIRNLPDEFMIKGKFNEILHGIKSSLNEQRKYIAQIQEKRHLLIKSHQ